MTRRSISVRRLGAALTAAVASLFAAFAIAGTAPAVGSAAPAFKLPDQAGKLHQLSDYRGQWVVLYFYPKDDTPGCTTQACNFRDDIFAFRRAGAVILGVSVDDVASHREFAEKHGLPFPLLADDKKAAAKAYGVLRNYLAFEIASRQTFLIDPQGRIAVHYPEADPKDGSKKVLADIARLQAAAKKG
ncbi:MAG: peroxiredoxin [Gammaproteobacteria bacterium]